MTGSPSHVRQRMVPCGAAGSYSRGHDEHVVAPGQLPRQLERVDLRAGAVPRQEVVDGVEERSRRHRPRRLARRGEPLVALHALDDAGVNGAMARASPHIRTAPS